ncbi:tRNA 2-thiouridine(34) synthase MnmA [Bacteroidales bacterium]|nr:tRNA 2-thiouridine(34) synthase MnmA [Bacteroidales bacterium]
MKEKLMSFRNNKILLALSGGVDSSMAAIMLKAQGFEVIGLTIKFWNHPDFADNIGDINAAIKLCRDLKIQHYVVDKCDAFSREVIEYFDYSYLNGKTPFPCAVCNPKVKWSALVEYANELGCYHIATGHYVDVVKYNNIYYITEGIDEDKDQSFFLWGLDQDTLSRSIFPLAGKNKIWVKEQAIKHGYNSLSVQKESTGVCFLKDPNYRTYISKIIAAKRSDIGKGNFIDENGMIVGQHDGYPYYTVGQRRGLGFGPSINKKYYVKEILQGTNEVVLSESKPAAKESFYVLDYFVHNKDDFKKSVGLKIRYRKQYHLATIEFIDEQRLKVHLQSPLDSIAPGQTAVFYSDKRVLGGGFIM